MYLIACRNVPTYQQACFKPSETLTGPISDLWTSISTSEECNEPSTSQFLTDPRYQKNNSYQNNSMHSEIEFSQSHTNIDQSSNSISKPEKFYVCGNHGFWFKNHTRKERHDVISKFKYRFSNRINKHVNQYLPKMRCDLEQETSSDDKVNYAAVA